MKNAQTQAWADDLRSGKFQQASSLLTDGTGYCCLGVLCVKDPQSTQVEVNAEAPGEPGFIVKDGDQNLGFYGAMPPAAVVNRVLGFGLTIPEGGLTTTLDVTIDINDKAAIRGESPGRYYPQGHPCTCGREPGTHSQYHDSQQGVAANLTAAGMNDSGMTFEQIADMVSYFGVHADVPRHWRSGE
jgi:hypothetical protein